MREKRTGHDAHTRDNIAILTGMRIWSPKSVTNLRQFLPIKMDPPRTTILIGGGGGGVVVVTSKGVVVFKFMAAKSGNGSKRRAGGFVSTTGAKGSWAVVFMGSCACAAISAKHGKVCARPCRRCVVVRLGGGVGVVGAAASKSQSGISLFRALVAKQIKGGGQKGTSTWSRGGGTHP